ncbi:MAG: hypothetical protein ACLQMH_11655 [Solirubrobacteraceae bacterium]
MPPVATGRPGRPAAAGREDTLAPETEPFLQGERVDVKAVVQELGLADRDPTGHPEEWRSRAARRATRIACARSVGTCGRRGRRA